MIPEHRRQLDKLAAALRKQHLTTLDDFDKAVYARLYCVELSGILEHLIRDCCNYYAKKHSNTEVVNFIQATSNTFPNPKADNIRKIVASFSKEWAIKLDTFWDGEIKTVIGSIVSNRHSIAHGRDSQVTLVRIDQWIKTTNKLSIFLWNDIFKNGD